MGADMTFYKQGNPVGFRDSYGPHTLLKELDLSWWVDVKPLHDKNGEMSPEQAEKFLWLVQDHFRTYLKERIEMLYNEENKQFFTNRYKELVDYLHEAITSKQVIHCSF